MVKMSSLLEVNMVKGLMEEMDGLGEEVMVVELGDIMEVMVRMDYMVLEVMVRMDYMVLEVMAKMDYMVPEVRIPPFP